MTGGYVGIDNVSGRIDYFIKNSVIEFKTKDTPIPDKNYVLTTFPQDLEQLLIYSAMFSNPSNTHYLIFTKEHGNIAERIFRAFKVTITDPEAIKNFTIRRRDDLSQALKSNDPSQLPKCRYFDTGCKFKEKKACNCDSLSPLDAQNLLRFISIIEDPILSSELQSIHDGNTIDYESRNISIDNIYNVIFPMRWYHSTYDYYENEEQNSTKTTYGKDAARTLIESAIFHSRITVSDPDRKGLMGKKNLDFEPHTKFLNANIPRLPKPIPIPYFVKISDSPYVFSDQWLPDFYLAQATLLAVNSNIKYAAIVINYPNVESTTSVYIATVDSEKVSKAVKSIKQAMRDSINRGDANDLPLCPKFYQDSCPIDSCLCKIKSFDAGRP